MLEIINQFQYKKIINNTFYLSTLSNKNGTPNVRIDSTIPKKSILFKINDNNIEIKAIVNTTDERGFLDSIINKLSINTIYIESDNNPEFWNKMIKRYNNIKWIKR